MLSKLSQAMKGIHNPSSLIAKIGGGLILTTFLFSCSDKDGINSPSDYSSDDNSARYYINLRVQTPSSDGTRSTTDNTQPGDSSDGELPAAENENSLTSAQIFLCDTDGNVLTYLKTSETGGLTGEENYKFTNTSSTDYRLKIEIDVPKLLKLKGQRLKMIMVGNYKQISHNLDSIVAGTTNISNLIDAVFSISSVDGDPIGDFGDGNKGKILPLVNKENFEIDFLKDVEDGDLTDVLAAIRAIFSEKDPDGGRVYSVTNTLKLERAVARIDFKDRADNDDKSQDLENFPSGVNTDYVYQIGASKVFMCIDQLQVFNVNTSSNLFRQTIKGTNFDAFGVNNEVIKLFGIEKNDAELGDGFYNWISSADWLSPNRKTPSFKNDLEINTTTKEHKINGTEGKVSVETLDGRTTHDSYHPWCYVSENTIPNIDLMETDKLPSQATGVAFTFKLLNKLGEDLEYSATGVNYPTAITKSTTTGADATTITITMPDGKWMDVEKVGDNYYLTYYAFLVHNDTTQDPETPQDQVDGEEIVVPGPMKYGVVRNNVYQISVNKVDNLPDPEDPKTLYLQLDIKVLPWTVRRNAFSF